MKKMRVEVCLISARGLGRTSSLWMKLQWYAVGWIDPNNKYCTRIDASGSKNPAWKTKFPALIDDDYDRDHDEDDRKSPSLHVQVYSREPLFLREKLQGTATVRLKEFIAKYYTAKMNNSLSGGGVEEVGSFQLRKKGSGKPQGFVDVSIRISEERNDGGTTFPNYYSGKNGEGFELGLGGAGPASNEIFIGGDGLSNVEDYHHHHNHPPHHQPSDHLHSPFQQRPPAPPYQNQPESTTIYPPVGYSTMSNNSNLQPSSSSSAWDRPSSYRPPPPPPPPPSHVGYIPTILPRTDNRFLGTYMNNGPRGGAAPAGQGGGGAGNISGFGMGMSGGAMAAGAVLFGDDFMSGFDIPPRVLP